MIYTKKKLLFTIGISILLSPFAAHAQEFSILQGIQDFNNQKAYYWYVAASGLVASGLICLLRQATPHAMAKGLFQAHSELDLELKEKLNAFFTKIGIEPNAITVLATNSPLIEVAVAVGDNVIVINENAFKDYTNDEIEFIIAHELAHLKNGDIAKLGLAALATPFIAHYGLQAWDALVNKAVAYGKTKVAPDGAADRALTNLNATNHLIATFCFTTALVGAKLFSTYSCYKERNADIDALNQVKTHKGACDFFARLQEKYKPLRKESFMHAWNIGENGDNYADTMHPLLSERIAYCQEWADLV